MDGQGRARGRGRASVPSGTGTGGKPASRQITPQEKEQVSQGVARGQPKLGPSTTQAPRANIGGRATLHRGPPLAGDEPGAAAGAEARGGGGNGNGNGNGRGAMRGKRYMGELLVTRPSSAVSKRGTSGTDVILQTNYFRINKRPEWELHQYRVDFSPDIELMGFRKKLLYEHKKTFGGFIFDGTVLYLTVRLENEPMELISKNRDGEPIKIIIKYTGVVRMTDYQSLQILNLILRRAMEGLHLQLVSRNFFDPQAKIHLNDYNLELWPGYTTSIRQHEQDILLCAEIAHKVMRTERIYDIMGVHARDARNYQNNFKKEVIGMVVLTDYNNKTYRVDDIDFKSNPKSTFATRNGPVSYMDYYKQKYNIKINDADQPLLVSRSTERNIRAGENELILLIPELCRATGISDDMRNNFKLMRAMSDHTRLSPSDRIDRLRQFNRRLQTAKESTDVLNEWQLSLDTNLVELTGRILKNENIVFGDGKLASSGPEADWTKHFRNNSMFTIVHLTNWVVLTTKYTAEDTRELVKQLRQAANGMKMKIDDPHFCTLNDDRTASYINKIEECSSRDPQLIMAIVPNNNAERYSSIKKKTCVDRAIPTQVVVGKTIARKGGSYRGLMSVATKIAIQLNCKLMGAPWLIQIPISGLMTIGFDVCHSAKDRAKSYGALVATMDLKIASKFYSTVSAHNRGQELSNDLALKVTQALKEYRALHGTLPARILFYRDGVGEGQLEHVHRHELKAITEKLDWIYKSANIDVGPRFAFIVVSKRINTRLFANKANPPPGTIVDDVITLPVHYDFFLVSQSVRQGTVSPTNYNVIHDTMGFEPEKLQILTYKMTHLYYNWSGTTRVPAVCQYAHKLAFLVGQYIHQSPSNLLEKQLYYL